MWTGCSCRGSVGEVSMWGGAEDDGQGIEDAQKWGMVLCTRMKL